MKEKLKVLKIIHIAMCLGLVVAYIVLGNLFEMKNVEFPQIDSASVVFACIPFVAIFISNFVFQIFLKKIDKKLPIEDNFEKYQTASIIRWAMLEGPAFIILILKPDFIIFGMLIIVYFFFIRPTEDKVNMELGSRNI